MRPISIADLQESSEAYKQRYQSRKTEYINATEATEEEFLIQEIDFWGMCIHDIQASTEVNPWNYLDNDNFDMVLEAIRLDGYDKILFSSKRKLEFIESLSKSEIVTISNTQKLPDSPRADLPAKLSIQTQKEENKAINKKDVKKPFKYHLRSVCIAIHVMGATVNSPEGARLLRKYTGNSSPPSLKNNIVIRTSEITAITENPNQDKWRKKFIEQAKRLLIAEKKHEAIQAITQLQKAFQQKLDSIKKDFTG